MTRKELVIYNLKNLELSKNIEKSYKLEWEKIQEKEIKKHKHLFKLILNKTIKTKELEYIKHTIFKCDCGKIKEKKKLLEFF